MKISRLPQFEIHARIINMLLDSGKLGFKLQKKDLAQNKKVLSFQDFFTLEMCFGKIINY